MGDRLQRGEPTSTSFDVCSADTLAAPAVTHWADEVTCRNFHQLYTNQVTPSAACVAAHPGRLFVVVAAL